MEKEIDFQHLGFRYTETDYIVRSDYHDGKWSPLYATQDKTINLHVAATCLHYGQEAFEGLKVFRGVDGQVRVFRMEDNAIRLQQSAKGLYMAQVPVEMFCEAIKLAVQKNWDYVPPYESGATLYCRPLLLGTSARLGVSTGADYTFLVMVSPVGPYYPAGFAGTPFIIDRKVDRAAPLGTGQFKAGGNYAASFRATEVAHQQGLSCIFLDAKHKRFIDECGAANFFGILPSKTGSVIGSRYITPRSTSILPSITNRSLMTLARNLGLRVEQRRVPVEELAMFSECGACGTAAVISPISKVIDPDKNQIYTFGTEPGPVCRTLYQALQDLQYGRAQDPLNWCTVIDPA